MNLFPFDNIRPGQKEFLADCRHAFEKGETLVAYAPTGIGKTAAALAGALEAKKEGETVFFLTSRQTQHAVAVETVRKIVAKTGQRVACVDIIGRQDMCCRTEKQTLKSGEFAAFCAKSRKGRTCKYHPARKAAIENISEGNLHAEESIESCMLCNSCAYEASFAAARQADVIVCDYNYLFSEGVRAQVFGRLQKQLCDALVIVDEAHNLPERIRRENSADLSLSLLKSASAEAKLLSNSVLHNAIGSLAYSVKALIGQERLSLKEEITEKLDAGLQSQFLTDFSLAKLKEELVMVDSELQRQQLSAEGESGCKRLWRFLQLLGEKSDSLSVIIQPDVVRICEADAAKHSRPVFEELKASILMSGTLYPPENYAALLGLDAKCKQYESPFPRENELIMVHSSLGTRFTRRSQEEYAGFANLISAFEQRIPGNVAVFFPSYAMLESISSELVTQRRILRESRDTDKEDLSRFMLELRKKKDGLLLAVNGGSLSEGMDFEDNSLKGIVVIGFPLAPPSAELKQRIDYVDRVFGDGNRLAYLLPAANKVMQASGRGIRKETDRTAILLADERFVEKKYLELLPEKFAAAAPFSKALLAEFFSSPGE